MQMPVMNNRYMLVKVIEENVAEENNCRIERKEWKSRYNSYVVYEYEPFCAEGFSINLVISSIFSHLIIICV